MPRTKLFVSYSHLDREWYERLVAHLAVLEGKGLLDVWADTRIGIGDKWRTSIDAELGDCQVAALLVSQNFLGSQFIRDVEVPKLLALHEKDGLVLLPVIARPCAWRLVDWLVERQCRPSGGRALSLGTEPEIDRDLALLTYEIAMQLGQAHVRVTDEIARLQAAARSDRGDRLTRPRGNAAMTDLSGRSWKGTYGTIGSVLNRSMTLTVRSSDERQVTGRIDWDDGDPVSFFEGELLVPGETLSNDPSFWREVNSEAGRPQLGLRFTDIRVEGSRPFERGGRYRAVVLEDAHIVGRWYRATDAAAVARFELQPQSMHPGGSD